MKKLLTLFLGIALILPLYSQEAKPGTHDLGNETGEEIALEEEGAEKEAPKPEKKKFDFTRKYFELGLGAGVGFDNGLVKLDDVLQKKIEFDLSKIAQGIPKDGAGFNFGPSVDFFMNVLNIHIGKDEWEGIWDFGFTANVDGNINVNIPKSLFTLISEGNADQHNSSGTIRVSGGIYTELGLTASAKYKIAGKTLYTHIKSAIYTPALYIPSDPGISYHLYTDKDGREGLFLDTGGAIEIYTAASFDPSDKMEAGRFIMGPSGFDLSLEGEYALFPFLDVGGSFTHIPFAPATLTNQMKIQMKDFSVELIGEDLIGGHEPDTPTFDFNTDYDNNVNKKVHRLLRFDVYARYKPLDFAPFNSEFLVLRPNIGFSANVNKGDGKGYFNAGLEARLNLINLFIFYMGSGYQESIWRQRIGFNLNLRAFELDLEAIFRDHTFAGSFSGQGFEFNLGMRFGW